MAQPTFVEIVRRDNGAFVARCEVAPSGRISVDDAYSVRVILAGEPPVRTRSIVDVSVHTADGTHNGPWFPVYRNDVCGASDCWCAEIGQGAQ